MRVSQPRPRWSAECTVLDVSTLARAQQAIGQGVARAECQYPEAGGPDKHE